MLGPAPRPTNRRQKPPSKDENEDLLVFGYQCHIFPQDDRAQFIAEERHLCPWNHDEDLKIDRVRDRMVVGMNIIDDLLFVSLTTTGYDCRMHLHSSTQWEKSDDVDNEGIECENDRMEEEMCDDERFKDLYEDISKKALEEEETKKKRAEIGFSYDDGPSSSGSRKVLKAQNDSDSEDEPFESPEGVKLPVGLECPPNQKINHIVLRTAGFVVEKGPQMEIVIKAKQRNSTVDQFGFLEFDNILNPYYKYMMKMIREKKYSVPTDFKKKKKTKKVSENNKLGALAAIAAAHGSSSDDDSESDCELHPSLRLSRRSATPDPLDHKSSGIGPRAKPASPPPRPAQAPKIEYRIDKATDMYASLFKSLASIADDERREREYRESSNSPHTSTFEDTRDIPVDEEFQQWWEWFYGSSPCPLKAPLTLIPPPPDLGPVVDSYAQYAAAHGAQGEHFLKVRAEQDRMPMNFLILESPHFSYYQNKVRTYQWQYGYYPPQHDVHDVTDVPPPPKDQPAVTKSDAIHDGSQVCEIAQATDESVSTDVVDSVASPMETTEPILEKPLLNRKQRRRLQDAPKVFGAAPPTVIDPIAMAAVEGHELPKAQSSPAILADLSQRQNEDEVESSAAQLIAGLSKSAIEERPHSPSPISFTLQVKSGEKKINGIEVRAVPPPASTVPVGVPPPLVPSAVSSNASAPVVPPVPAPPSIQNDVQLERKEKARLFMEKLLNEKRLAKKRAEEEEEKRKKEAVEAAARYAEQRLAQAQAQKEVEEGEISSPVRSDRRDREDRDKKKRRHRSRSRSRDRNRKEEKPVKTVDMIDKLISSKINSLLETTTGIKLEEAKKEVSANGEDDERDKKRKKEKKKKERKDDRHRRSLSRDSSTERNKKRRRSRSRSRGHRSSRHRH